LANRQPRAIACTMLRNVHKAFQAKTKAKTDVLIQETEASASWSEVRQRPRRHFSQQRKVAVPHKNCTIAPTHETQVSNSKTQAGPRCCKFWLSQDWGYALGCQDQGHIFNHTA